MSIAVDAVYEQGVLKPERCLPLQEHARVQITVLTTTAESRLEAVERSYGMLRWTGDVETLRRVAEGGWGDARRTSGERFR